MFKNFFISSLFVIVSWSLMAAPKFKKGDLVLANFEENSWAYPARIVLIKDGIITVKYEEDGTTEELAEEFIQPYDWSTGSKIQCNWQKKGKYYSGKITKMQGINIHMAYDDGDQEDTTTTVCRVQNREVKQKAAENNSSGSSEVMLTLKNACSSGVNVREEKAGGGTYHTEISSGANIYRSFNVGDTFTIVNSGASITIRAEDWNAIEIDSSCSSWCVIDKYNSKNCK